MTEKQERALAPYFFLSYARSAPLAGHPHRNPDHLVERFYKDLTEAVRTQASLAAEVVSGFFDQKIPVGSDWKQSITEALSAAQVFVPLYSVSYLTNSWPGREFACFKQRVEQAGGPNQAPRLVPVLWAPLAGGKEAPGLREALAAGAEPDYAENGLRALLKLRYRDLYETVVNNIAKQIVDLAESDPIDPVQPSQVPDLEIVQSEFSPDTPLAIFDIEVAVPPVADGDPHAHARAPLTWRPFQGQKLPLAEHARQITERFNFDGRVSEASPSTEATRQRPGIIIIDPSFVATKQGAAAFRLLANFPRWIMPLVVLGDPDNRHTRELADQVRAILRVDRLPTESARLGARGVKSLDDFVSLVPVLVAEAERQYLRYRTGHVPSTRPAGRPRLGQGDGSDEATGGPDL